MKDEAPQDEEAVPRHGKVASATLRLIDAGLHSLQRLRDRMEPPAAEEDAPRGHAKSKEPAEDASWVAASAPLAESLLRRVVIVLACLLLGGGAGTLLSYRGFSKALDTRKTTIENLQDEIRQSKKDEAALVKSKEKYQKDAGDFRKQLRETQLELENCKSQVDNLAKKPTPAKRIEPPTSQRKQEGAATSRQLEPQKSGTCVADAKNPGADVLECLQKFKKP